MYNLWNNEANNYDSNSRFLARLNITLASHNCSPDRMKKVLATIANHYGYDRIDIITIHPDRTFSVPYEWCQKTVTPLKNNTKTSCFYAKELEDQLNTLGYIYIQTPEEIHSPELKAYLQAYNTADLLMLPLFSRYLFSFIAFSHCSTPVSTDIKTIPHLEMLADMIATNMEKNLTIQKLFFRLLQTAKISSTPIYNRF